jgi:hypothetical protein
VCRHHGGVYDPAPHPVSGQQQLCHGRDTQEKWPHFDFNEWVHLCESCLQDTAASGSRFSPFFCETCRVLVKHHAPAVPIGRHTLMNGGALPPQVDVVYRRMNQLVAATTALHEWSQGRLRGLIGPGDGDMGLADVMAEARRRWDKEQAVAELREYWRPARRR